MYGGKCFVQIRLFGPPILNVLALGVWMAASAPGIRLASAKG